MTMDVYQSVHGEEPQERSLFGWKDSGGVTEIFPTNDSEKVFVGDSVLVYDEVHVNPCYSWYVGRIVRMHRRAILFIARRYAKARSLLSPSVCPSVCTSH